MNYKKPLKIITYSITLITILTIATYADLTIHYLDVGQADSILLQLPNNQNMLIDAGNNADGDFVVDYIEDQGITKIDYLVGTHPHEDHIGGLDFVIKSFDIGKIYLPRAKHTTKTYEDVLRAIKVKDKKIILAKAAVNILNKPDLEAYFLSPVREDYDELNEWSAVLKLEYGNTSFLFTGDAEEINEFEILLSSSMKPDADVLKVGHHGSDSSTSEAFLAAVSPRYAVISVGKDSDYGHPSPVVLDRLRDHNVKVFRTDLQGTIICTSDGENITFNVDSSVIISLVDLKDELVVIKNTGDKPVDLSGWRLLSVKGNQDFYFPTDTTLQPGKKIIIASGRNAKDGSEVIIWTKVYIWNDDGDPAELYDDKGKLVSSYWWRLYMLVLVIDRFEEYIAIISHNGTTFEIPKYYLPDNAKEGDVIKIIIDEVATRKRKKKVNMLANELFE